MCDLLSEPSLLALVAAPTTYSTFSHPNTPSADLSQGGPPPRPPSTPDSERGPAGLLGEPLRAGSGWCPALGGADPTGKARRGPGTGYLGSG